MYLNQVGYGICFNVNLHRKYITSILTFKNEKNDIYFVNYSKMKNMQNIIKKLTKILKHINK